MPVQTEPPKTQLASVGPVLTYSFTAANGGEVASSSMQGRATLAVLVTTYDWSSQLVLRRVNQALGSFVPKINAFGVVLEPASYAVLVKPFEDSLELKFPLVMADLGSLDGGGPFGPIEHVPTTIVLDRQGRITARLKGPVSAEEIEQALRAALGLEKLKSIESEDR